MAIKYTFEKRGDILYAFGAGLEESLEQNKDITRQLSKASQKFECTKLLVDDRNVIYTSSILSLYELAKFYSTEDSLNKIYKVAVLANPKYKENNDFYETTARNRYLNLHVFYSCEQAEEWLSET